MKTQFCFKFMFWFGAGGAHGEGAAGTGGVGAHRLLSAAAQGPRQLLQDGDDLPAAAHPRRHGLRAARDRTPRSRLALRRWSAVL